MEVLYWCTCRALIGVTFIGGGSMSHGDTMWRCCIGVYSVHVGLSVTFIGGGSMVIPCGGVVLVYTVYM